ncbi:hypothetical protein K439DRAFT_1405827 [Ramaria rubella]|nr:hypothetical protein K439DRAFT_1405827 [Ramaria rubella]
MDLKDNELIVLLQNHVTHLTSLAERVNTLRKIPGLLLAPSTLTGSQLEQGFKQINELKDVIGGTHTQDCLKLAHESFSKSSDDVGLEGRQQSRKRRRPPSPTPDSPRPPPALPKHIFPPSSCSSSLTASQLLSYIRGHNATGTEVKLHIWTPTRPRPPENASVLAAPSNCGDYIVRVSIKDVLYAYLRLGVEDTTSLHRAEQDKPDVEYPEGRLIVENVSVFGPRERKSPHSQSDFMVFQKLSQHVAWMIQAEPAVELRTLVALFISYETLFVSQCTVCHRVLSEEGHFPPVCRIWMPLRRANTQDKESAGALDDSEGRWEPRHRTCLVT